MSINDGGPAFPHEGQHNYTGGMTLRDYFAGQALANGAEDILPGTIGDAAALIGIRACDWHGPTHNPLVLAARCYAIADAMIAWRSRTT